MTNGFRKTGLAPERIAWMNSQVDVTTISDEMISGSRPGEVTIVAWPDEMVSMEIWIES